MRRLLSFPCAGETLFASLDEGTSATGVVIVSGGTEIRSGAHGGMAALAASLAAAGHPVLRFDRRGVGDSSGEDPGFSDSGPDIASAVATLRTACPNVARVHGFGLCDGATALAFHHRAAGIDALVLANPWVVKPSDGLPPPAAIRRRYRERLTSRDGWRRLLTGRVRYGALLRGMAGGMRRRGSLADEVAAALAGTPTTVLLAGGDATAIGFESCWSGKAFEALRNSTNVSIVRTSSGSHSFAGAEEGQWLAAACLDALSR